MEGTFLIELKLWVKYLSCTIKIDLVGIEMKFMCSGFIKNIWKSYAFDI